MLAIHFGTVPFVWLSQDRVSISFGVLKLISCVDFSKIMYRFRQVFIGVRLRFEKYSPRWRIVGREEIRGDKIHRESFLNSLEEIAQRSEFKRSENVVHSRP